MMLTQSYSVPKIRCRVKRERLVISFSGGKTSAYMLVWIMQVLIGQHAMWSEVVIVFANTGLEHPRTLEYIDEIARAYGLHVVWLEAVVDPLPDKGTRHRVVDFATAARRGEPFEDVVKKYGLPNSNYPHCTRETKANPIRSYLRSIGWAPNTYNVAIGLRVDELDRIDSKAMELGVIYPLVDKLTTKVDIVLWDRLVALVTLGIPEHWGNCITCWKKSLRKLITVARELPESFTNFAKYEVAYPNTGAGEGDRRLFRERKTTADIFELARNPHILPFVDDGKWESQSELDLGGACSDSCEIGVDGSHCDLFAA